MDRCAWDTLISEYYSPTHLSNVLSGIMTFVLRKTHFSPMCIISLNCFVQYDGFPSPFDPAPLLRWIPFSRPLREKIKSCRNPRNHGLQQLYGTPERTLTSDLSLRRRLLYTTELLRHIDFALRSILDYYSGNLGRCQGLKKCKMPLYRWFFFRYNKLICYGYHTISMEILI